MAMRFVNAQWKEDSHVLSYDWEVTNVRNSGHPHQEYHAKVTVNLLLKKRVTP
jgi:hypothetical protein